MKSESMTRENPKSPILTLNKKGESLPHHHEQKYYPVSDRDELSFYLEVLSFRLGFIKILGLPDQSRDGLYGLIVVLHCKILKLSSTCH